MKPNRALVLAGYLIAAMLVLIPLSEVLMAGLPLRPASVTWRFTAGQTFSRALMTPLLGLLLALGIALAFRHKRGVLVLGAASAAFGLLALTVAARFSFDAAAMLGGAPPGAKTPLMRTIVPVLVKLFVSILVAGLLSLGAWWAREATDKAARQGQDPSHGSPHRTGEREGEDLPRTRAPIVR